MLKIASNLSLPLDFVTQTQAILAKRGVGKSYTASVEAEEMLKAKQQVCVIDPTGAWFGLKSSADGKHVGFPIAVFGGDHADVPLEEHAGEIVARAIVEQGFSAILDLSLLRKGARNRLMADFLEALFRLNRAAMHLFIDEAHTVAPQKPFDNQARTLGAAEDIVMLGRRRGIGCTLITQRPQVLNKNVLTQCEVLCAMRLVHPKDIDAIEEWINVHADPDQAKVLIDSLPSLPIGTAWFWSPGFGDIFKRVEIRKRETFDSSATPKAGEKIRTPKVLAPIDIAALGAQIAETAERAKENDPTALRLQIAKLREELRKKELFTAVEVKRVEVPILKEPQIKRLEKAVERLASGATFLAAVANELKTDVVKTISAAATKTVSPPVVTLPGTNIRIHQGNAAPGQKEGVHDFGRGASGRSPIADAIDAIGRDKVARFNGSLPIGERKVLTAIAQFAPVDRDQLSVLSGYKKSSRDAYVSRLMARGYVSAEPRGLVATQSGEQALGDFEPLPTGAALYNYWLLRLPEGERRILEAVISKGEGGPVWRADLDGAGYMKSSRDAYISRLMARKILIPAGAGMVAPSPSIL